MPPTMTRHCSVELTCDLSAPRTARHLITLLLRHWGITDQDVADAATIVASELVTNVLVHCDDGGPITMVLEVVDDALHLQVEDRTPAVPTQRVAAAMDENGRGLGIVTQLVARWEIQRLPDGKRVAVELPLPKECRA